MRALPLCPLCRTHLLWGSMTTPSTPPSTPSTPNQPSPPTRTPGRFRTWFNGLKAAEQGALIGLTTALLAAVATIIAAVISSSGSTTSEADNKPSPSASASERADDHPPNESPTPSPATPTPSPPPTPSTSPSPSDGHEGYEVGYEDRSITLSQSKGGCGSSVADLDEPAVQAGEVSMDGSDLLYNECGYDDLSGGTYFGTASPTLPTPEDCAADAKTNGVGSVEQGKLEAGQAYCLITDEDAVVWMKLTKVGPDGPRGPDAVFRVTMWRPVVN